MSSVVDIGTPVDSSVEVPVIVATIGLPLPTKVVIFNKTWLFPTPNNVVYGTSVIPLAISVLSPPRNNVFPATPSNAVLY